MTNRAIKPNTMAAPTIETASAILNVGGLLWLDVEGLLEGMFVCRGDREEPWSFV